MIGNDFLSTLAGQPSVAVAFGSDNRGKWREFLDVLAGRTVVTDPRILVEAIKAGAPLSSLVGASLHAADLKGVSLAGVDLRGADLSHANLAAADLRNADLRNADVSHGRLDEADLRNADLRMANLDHASLIHAELDQAEMGGMLWDSRTRWDGYAREILIEASVEREDESSGFAARSGTRIPVLEFGQR